MLAVVFVLLLCCKAIAVPLADFYQFGSDVGNTELPRDDDDDSSPIGLLHPLTVFGTSYNVTFVSNLIHQYIPAFSVIITVHCQSKLECSSL